MKPLFITLLIILMSYNFLFSQNEDPICDKVNCIGSCGKFPIKMQMVFVIWEL